MGTELRQARERAGLSVEQMSERTKIQLYKVEALENGTFELLPQGIYLDGIVRAYAKELGVDQEAMVDRVRLERGTLPGDWPVPFAGSIELHPHATDRDDLAEQEHIHVTDDGDGNDPLDFFAAEKDVARVPIPQREQREYYAPRPVEMPPRRMRRPRRRSGLALPLLALVAGVGVGMLFYQMRPTLERETTPVAAESASQPAVTDDTAARSTSAGRSENSPADPLSSFTENVITPERRPPPASNPSAVPRDTPGISDTTPPQSPSVSNAASPAAAGNPSAEAATPARAPSMPESKATTGSVPNLTGAWTLATQVESSSLARFQGLQLGYEMQLKQNGVRVTGVGRKVTENGAGIGRQAQTPLRLSGTIEGDRLTLNFVERGVRRSTQGKFVLMVDEGGTLRGRFSSNAARSSGSVEARRVSTQ